MYIQKYTQIITTTRLHTFLFKSLLDTTTADFDGYASTDECPIEGEGEEAETDLWKGQERQLKRQYRIDVTGALQQHTTLHLV